MKQPTRFIIALLACTILSLTWHSCKQKSVPDEPEINPAFTGYVSGFTSGVISNTSSIRVKMMDDVSGVDINEPVDKKLFDFSPNIKGQAFWIDSRTLEFRPAEHLPSGKLFEAEFFLSRVMKVPSDLETLKFQFQTIRQAVFVNFDGIKPYSDDNLAWQQVNGNLTTADFADVEKVEGLLTATQGGKKLSVSWEHDGGSKVHKFTVDSVQRKEARQEVMLTWDGGDIGAEEDGEETIEVPPLGEFKLLDISVNQQPSQHVALHFSDPVNYTQSLKGLIYLKGGGSVRLTVEGNEVKVFPGRRVDGKKTIIIDQGVKNTLDYQLVSAVEREVTFSNIKPAVELMGNGVILPSTNGLHLPFKAVNLSAVNVKIVKVFEENVHQFLQVNQHDGNREMKRVGRIVYRKEVPLTTEKPIDFGSWNTFSLDLSDMINTEPGAFYKVYIGFDKTHSLYPCEGEEDDVDEISYQESNEDAQYDGPGGRYYYYDDYYDYDYDDYDYSDRDNPCKPSYYMRGRRTVSRNVFASDLGLIAKSGDGNQLFAAVTNIRTAEPASGVSVEIYNYQNQLMATQSTDGDGMVKIDLERKPFLLVAKQGAQRGYLRLDDGSALSMSMFDVGGNKLKKGVKGFIYGERGVWRPGDSIYVSFILEDKNEMIPDNHPVVFELYTPESQLYLRKIRTNAVNDFYDFRTATEQDAPTGNWLAKVKVGGSSFTKTIKIETVKPNRLKIKIDFGGEVLKNTAGIRGEMNVKWLHGAKAGNLKTDVELLVSEGRTTFKEFPGYNFDDPAKSFESEEEKIFEGNLDADGNVSFDPKIKVGDDAPGMLKARFKTRVFEKGGEFSVDRYVIPYSPYRGYVGVKVPEGEGWSNALYSNEPNLIPIVTVDEDGKPVDRRKLKIEIYDVRWRWWWERNDHEDLGNYISRTSNILIKSDYVDTKDGKAVYEMKFDKRLWGRKLIRITDPETGHSTGQLFYMTYKGWWTQSGQDNPGGAEMLTFSTDKKKYKVGEDVTIELPGFKAGKALISVESGSKVLQTFWIDANPDGNSISFEVTDAMAPNVYIHVSLVQPHAQVENDMPIRLFGVIPISVEDPNTYLKPVISMPDELAPESEVTIKISEADGKPMTYTVAVVDEGLLDLTRFKTPAPWPHFYAREALGVKTWDMYKFVMGAFSGEMAGLLALGGDEFLNQKDKKKANRFRPVVKFFGPFEMGSGDEETIKFKMPNYVGSVRTMVVAGQNGAYGNAEKATPVKKPLMVLATLPRVVGPTERVTLPVTVFAMDKKVKNVNVEVQFNDKFKLKDSDTKTITFAEEGDQIVNFDLEVAETIGIGKVKVIVTGAGERAEYDIELDVRLPNPRITETIDGVIEPGQSWSSAYTAVGVAGTNSGMLEVSTIPPLNLEHRLKYLIRYPHGCIEQTTSSVFPQLHLAALLDLDADKKAEIQGNITSGINRLKSFQIAGGGMSYWPGEYGEASDWGTNYAGHFMIEAKNKGYALPVGFLDQWTKFQRQRANTWQRSEYGGYRYRSSEMTQAYRLYTLALAGSPALGAMNRMREIASLSVTAKWPLAGAYFLAGKEEVARAMVREITTSVEPYKELSYTYGSHYRDMAMILEVLTLMDDPTRGKKVLDELVEAVGSGRWYSTQTTAFSLLAIAKFVGGDGSGKGLDFSANISGRSEKANTNTPVKQIKMEGKEIAGGNVSVTNNMDKRLFVKVQLDGIPLIGDQTSEENNLKMVVKYMDLEGNALDPAVLVQGTDLMAEVTISHPGVSRNYKEMALTQIFPSGWEIRNMRMDEGDSKLVKDKPRYQDIRDDRVYSYFNISKNRSKTYRVLLNASYLGRFYLPTVYCEAMYDNEINARAAGKWVEVVEPGVN